MVNTPTWPEKIIGRKNENEITKDEHEKSCNLEREIMNKIRGIKVVIAVMVFFTVVSIGFAEEMDSMWGSSVAKLRSEDAQRGQLFADGNYAMFIHWGVYSHLGNKVDDKTYYGIGEWIKHEAMAGISGERDKTNAQEGKTEKIDGKGNCQRGKEGGREKIINNKKDR